MGNAMGLNLKLSVVRAGIRLAWTMIETGRDIWEAAEPQGLHWTTDRLVSLGKRLEAAGEALESRVDAFAVRQGLDVATVLKPLVAAGTASYAS